MNNTQAFTFYRNYYEIIKYLPSKEKLQLYDAILEYMFEDKEPELKELLKGIWINIKMPLDNNKKNIKNGQKGGRPKQIKEQDEKPKENPKETQKKPKAKANNISYFLFLFSNIYISNLDNKDNIYKLLEEYLEIRIKNKYTLTETIVKRLINKLNEYGKTDEDKEEIILKAINGKWKDFYPLGDNKPQNRFLKYAEETKPEWFDKELKNEELTKEEKQELDNELNDLLESINEIGV